MKIHKQLAALMTALLLCCTASTTALAHEIPTGTGSITITMTYGGQPVGGGSLILYRVGDVAMEEDTGDFYFTPTEEFKDSGLTSEDMSDTELAASSAELAAELASYVRAEGLTGTSVNIGSGGSVTIGDRELGLYLIVQDVPADGFEAISPFLISVPMQGEDGSYVYHVKAESKMGELTKKPAPTTPSGGGSEPSPDPSTDSTPTPAASTPVTPAASVTPSVTLPAMPAVTDPGTLPQTGQLNWPVPVLAAFGLCLIAAGWALRCGGQRKHHGA